MFNPIVSCPRALMLDENTMDIPKIKRTYPMLIKHMEESGYGRVAIGSVNVRLRLLFEHEGEYESYEEFYSRFISEEGMGGNNKRLKYYRTSVRIIQAFDEYGHLPNRLKFGPVQYRESAFSHLNEHYRLIVEAYKMRAKEEGKTDKSITVESNAVSKLFHHFQQNGEHKIEDVTESSVLSFFYSDGKAKRSNAYLSKIRSALKTCLRADRSDLEKVLAFLPRIKKGRDNYAILSDSEIDIIKRTLEQDDSINLRDKAVISTAMFTGLRGTDLANLSKTNLDWDNDRLSLVQSKTGQPVVLPLLTSIGNPLMDYILGTRPQDASLPNIFLNLHSVETPVRGDTIGDITRRFFARCGITPPVGQNGIRLFRRYLATKVLRNGDKPAIISSILGHICQESLTPYLDADIEHLRECGLDVSMYPVGKEVLDV